MYLSMGVPLDSFQVLNEDRISDNQMIDERENERQLHNDQLYYSQVLLRDVSNTGNGQQASEVRNHGKQLRDVSNTDNGQQACEVRNHG